MNEKNKKTFWPYGILLAIFAIIVACIVTVIISLDYPVYKDNFYFDMRNVYTKDRKVREIFKYYPIGQN